MWVSGFAFMCLTFSGFSFFLCMAPLECHSEQVKEFLSYLYDVLRGGCCVQSENFTFFQSKFKSNYYFSSRLIQFSMSIYSIRTQTFVFSFVNIERNNVKIKNLKGSVFFSPGLRISNPFCSEKHSFWVSAACGRMWKAAIWVVQRLWRFVSSHATCNRGYRPVQRFS